MVVAVNQTRRGKPQISSCAGGLKTQKSVSQKPKDRRTALSSGVSLPSRRGDVAERLGTPSAMGQGCPEKAQEKGVRLFSGQLGHEQGCQEKGVVCPLH